MFTVAIIGGDGAGKSTIVNMLKDSFPLRLKYLYMGVSYESTNVALPTTRFIEKLKKGDGGKNGTLKSTEGRNGQMKKKSKGKIWAMLRLFNRLAEEWYRQWLSWRLRRDGSIVLYDRYFSFDYARNPNEPDAEYRRRPLNDRLHRWFLTHLYPNPDVVIFLHAPPAVLFARKGEHTIQFLDDLQQTYLKKGEKIENFYKIDATQPVEKVYQDVCDIILSHYRQRKSRDKVGRGEKV